MTPIPDALLWGGVIMLLFAILAFIAEQLERRERNRRIEQAHRRNTIQRRIES